MKILLLNWIALRFSMYDNRVTLFLLRKIELRWLNSEWYQQRVSVTPLKYALRQVRNVIRRDASVQCGSNVCLIVRMCANRIACGNILRAALVDSCLWSNNSSCSDQMRLLQHTVTTTNICYLPAPPTNIKEKNTEPVVSLLACYYSMFS